ncbi:MAG: HAD family hydrolase [Spirochaetes bacterium]|nr:HAD family hydrolase [Spirochaetota bacterium]
MGDLSLIKCIAFDADDTLWVNETYFLETEQAYCELFKDIIPEKEMSEKLFATEMRNLSIYGFGVKSFTLSMIETALNLNHPSVTKERISKALKLGQDLLKQPVEVFPEVNQILVQLKNKYRLIVATKGDLHHQERKLKDTGMEAFFHHIEIMSDKKEKNYLNLLNHLDIKPQQFLMIGNSLKSDIEPVINIGAQAIHIPFHHTWEFEKASQQPLNQKNYFQVEKITDIMTIIPI